MSKCIMKKSTVPGFGPESRTARVTVWGPANCQTSYIRSENSVTDRTVFDFHVPSAQHCVSVLGDQDCSEIGCYNCGPQQYETRLARPNAVQPVQLLFCALVVSVVPLPLSESLSLGFAGAGFKTYGTSGFSSLTNVELYIRIHNPYRDSWSGMGYGTLPDTL
ncbi:hypothetical protein K438DRAFT_1765275 [Mycena galopus ATCC 62051]|nr:hypothetical protein K438DRAFT_1765275 [Mycena galopus ATCC 62051]